MFLQLLQRPIIFKRCYANNDERTECSVFVETETSFKQITALACILGILLKSSSLKTDIIHEEFLSVKE